MGNKEQSITIQSSGGLSDAEIEQMVRDAEANAESDAKRKDLIEAKNNAESTLYNSEKSFNEHKDKLAEADQKAVEEAITKVRGLLETDDPELLKEATQELS